MRIYHYAPYEVTAMRRLMGKYATREDKVDDLPRNDVFVDLYRIVQQSLRLGTDSYSLKQVEKIYREEREGDVQTALGSVVYYGQWLESEQSRDWTESKILRKIRDDNEDDCESTWELAEWLRRKQEEHGIVFSPPADPGDQAD